MELYTKHSEVVKWEIKMALLYPSCMPKSDSLLYESNNTPSCYKKVMVLERKGCQKVISLSSYYLTILYLGYGLMTFGVMAYYIPLSYVLYSWSSFIKIENQFDLEKQ